MLLVFTYITPTIFLKIYYLVLVLYAPHLGAAGLDDTDVKDRFEVFRVEYHVEDEDQSITWRDMDETIPFYPEVVFYRVFSIAVGKTPFFCVLVTIIFM